MERAYTIRHLGSAPDACKADIRVKLLLETVTLAGIWRGTRDSARRYMIALVGGADALVGPSIRVAEIDFTGLDVFVAH